MVIDGEQNIEIRRRKVPIFCCEVPMKFSFGNVGHAQTLRGGRGDGVSQQPFFLASRLLATTCWPRQSSKEGRGRAGRSLQTQPVVPHLSSRPW